jgi:branched-subunit amino acid aminotransferase/4-amino-4-deoxychorismate lyase
MRTNALFHWDGTRLRSVGPRTEEEDGLAVADSWLVAEGRALALQTHRDRFLGAIPADARAELDASAFWEAAMEQIPPEGQWFPRVEFRRQADEWRLALLLRPAPPLSRTVRVVTHRGRDPRTTPSVKGPDLHSLAGVRAEAARLGADEAVILEPSGHVSDGASSAILWWQGETLCAPPPEFPRVDSVTARSLLTLATGLGVAVRHQAITPAELDGREVWAVNALHGIRIVTAWIGGPALAREPGRLDLWRARLEALRRPTHASHAEPRRDRDRPDEGSQAPARSGRGRP